MRCHADELLKPKEGTVYGGHITGRQPASNEDGRLGLKRKAERKISTSDRHKLLVNVLDRHVFLMHTKILESHRHFANR